MILAQNQKLIASILSQNKQDRSPPPTEYGNIRSQMKDYSLPYQLYPQQKIQSQREKSTNLDSLMYNENNEEVIVHKSIIEHELLVQTPEETSPKGDNEVGNNSYEQSVFKQRKTSIVIDQLKRDAEKLNQLNFTNIQKKVSLNNTYRDISRNENGFELNPEQFASSRPLSNFKPFTARDYPPKYPGSEKKQYKNQSNFDDYEQINHQGAPHSPIRNNILSELSSIMLPQAFDQSGEISVKDSILDNLGVPPQEIFSPLSAKQKEAKALPPVHPVPSKISPPKLKSYIDMSCSIQLSGRSRNIPNTSLVGAQSESENDSREVKKSNQANPNNFDLANIISKASPDEASSLLKNLVKENHLQQKPLIGNPKVESRLYKDSEGIYRLSEHKNPPVSPRKIEDISSQSKTPTKERRCLSTLSKVREAYKAQILQQNVAKFEVHSSPKKIMGLGAARELAKNFKMRLNKLVNAAENNSLEKSAVEEVSKLAQEYNENKAFLAESDFAVLRNLGAKIISMFGNEPTERSRSKTPPPSQSKIKSVVNEQKVVTPLRKEPIETHINNHVNRRNKSPETVPVSGKVLKKTNGKNKGKAEILSNINSNYSKALNKFCKGSAIKPEIGSKQAINKHAIIANPQKSTNENKEKDSFEAMNIDRVNEKESKTHLDNSLKEKSWKFQGKSKVSGENEAQNGGIDHSGMQMKLKMQTIRERFALMQKQNLQKTAVVKNNDMILDENSPTE